MSETPGGTDILASRGISVPGFTFLRTLKEDFFSENHLLEKDGKKYVVKFSRARFPGGSILRFAARFLCAREAEHYRLASGIAGVPALAGLVGRDGFIHEYVEGRTLKEVRRQAKQEGTVATVLPADFFVRLGAIVRELHRREMAYVDLAKEENILVTDDRSPALIDFQVSFHPRKGGLYFLTQPLYRILAREDLYHLLKHKGRFHPHLLTVEERKVLEHRSFIARVYRVLINRPWLILKRLIYPKNSDETFRFSKKYKSAQSDVESY